MVVEVFEARAKETNIADVQIHRTRTKHTIPCRYFTKDVVHRLINYFYLQEGNKKQPTNPPLVSSASPPTTTLGAIDLSTLFTN